MTVAFPLQLLGAGRGDLGSPPDARAAAAVRMAAQQIWLVVGRRRGGVATPRDVAGGGREGRIVLGGRRRRGGARRKLQGRAGGALHPPRPADMRAGREEAVRQSLIETRRRRSVVNSHSDLISVKDEKAKQRETSHKRRNAPPQQEE